MNKRLQRLAVLKGGLSAEREVSLESGAAVSAGLREAGYVVSEIDVISPEFTIPASAEAVFIALHGTFGEDGRAQAQLEALGIPYAGSGVEASRVSFDKILTEQCLHAAKIPVPESETLRAGQTHTFPFPLVLKPARQGSSVGCHLVLEETDWKAAFADALQYGETVLVQRFIPGREFTVGIVDLLALPVVEIVIDQGWYDYTAKYKTNTTHYIVPAILDADRVASMQHLAIKTFEALGAHGFGRIDFRMNPDGKLFVLELNTIPGFTAHSLLPKAAAAAGIEFSTLCDRIVQTISI